MFEKNQLVQPFLILIFIKLNFTVVLCCLTKAFTTLLLFTGVTKTSGSTFCFTQNFNLFPLGLFMACNDHLSHTFAILNELFLPYKHRVFTTMKVMCIIT